MSSAVKWMPRAVSVRATMWPTRPKPAMMIAASSGSIFSYSRLAFAVLRLRSASSIAMANGVNAIEIVTAITSVPASCACTMPPLTAIANSTNANSPPCDRVAASERAVTALCPAIRATTNRTTAFVSIKPATIAAMRTGSLTINRVRDGIPSLRAACRREMRPGTSTDQPRTVTARSR